MAITSPDKSKKYLYDNKWPVMFRSGRWLVNHQGEWKEFNDWKNATDPTQIKTEAQKKSWWFKITQKRWLNDWHDLNPTQRSLLLTLWLYGGNKCVCWPSIRQLCDDLGLHDQAVQNGIKELKKLKYIQVEKCVNQKGKYNKYRLLK